jgi:hypothetical protein
LHLWHHRYAPIARYGHSGQAHCTGVALAERFCLSSRARRICAGSCEPMPAITTRSECTGHWIRMRRSPVQSSRPETSNHTLFWVDFITITPGSSFRHTQVYEAKRLHQTRISVVSSRGRAASICFRRASRNGGSFRSRPSESSASSTAKPGWSVAISKRIPPGSRK